MLAVVYLIFNEGYGGRNDLAAEAIRLGRALAELMPDEPEAHGLLALMLLHDARREARFAAGTLVLLGDQDRSLWDPGRSPRDGRRWTGRSRSAAAASTRCRRRSPPSTSSGRRTGRRSRRSTASSAPHRLAGGRAEPRRRDRRGRRRSRRRALIEGLDPDRYHPFHAARAELLRRLGPRAEAQPL